MILSPFADKAYKERFALWKKWLSEFKKEGVEDFTYIPQAAWLLNDMYWALVRQYIRELVALPVPGQAEHRIHHYKIISASEITVMMVMPIICTKGDKMKERHLNATLAFFIATEIITNWKTAGPKIGQAHANKISTYQESIFLKDSTKKYGMTFSREHVEWLAVLNPTIEKPILSNAQTWRMFFIACLAVAKKGKLPR